MICDQIFMPADPASKLLKLFLLFHLASLAKHSDMKRLWPHSNRYFGLNLRAVNFQSESPGFFPLFWHVVDEGRKFCWFPTSAHVHMPTTPPPLSLHVHVPAADKNTHFKYPVLHINVWWVIETKDTQHISLLEMECGCLKGWEKKRKKP